MLMGAAGTAFACTNYVGRMTLTGSEASSPTATTDGLQCAGNVSGGNPNCLQGMSLDETDANGLPETTPGGTLTFTMGTAPSGTGKCSSISGTPAPVCHLNASSSINSPTGNKGPYNVTVIQTGFPTHSPGLGYVLPDSSTDHYDCMTWPGQSNPLTQVGYVTTDTSGVLTGATQYSTYTAPTYNSMTHAVTITVPSTYSLNDTASTASGLCISDPQGEDGNQAPFLVS